MNEDSEAAVAATQPAGCCCGKSGPAVPSPGAQRERSSATPSAASAVGAQDHVVSETPGALPGAAFVDLPGGEFAIGDPFGDGNPADGEQPRHAVALDPFAITATTVTNAQFAAFVDATGYVTTAEQYGSSAVFHLLVEPGSPARILGRDPQIPWWLEVQDASWKAPEGAGSGIGDRMDHPVVHVSWDDARAFCAWSGTRLPTEAQWEFAARGGLNGRRCPWGNRLPDQWRCNIWQGTFPTENTRDDGYLGTAPANAYEPNGYGLFNTVGNVWEWCADFFARDYYVRSPELNPEGPAAGDRRIMRGGSFLCHDSYCNRYRVAARSSNTAESSASNIGFRVVR